MRRRTLWPRVVVVWAAVVAAVATDWPLAVLSPFWAEHSMVAGVASGLLLLVAGLFGVEAIIERRDARRWQIAARVAFKELGFACDELRKGMRMLLTADYGFRFNIPFDADFRGELASALARHPELDGEDDATRLRILLDDHEWTRLAELGLDWLKHRHRGAIAAWSPVMMSSSELAGLLARVAELNEHVFSMQDPLKAIARGEGDRETCDAAVVRWRSTSRAAVSMQEELMQAADLAGWEHRAAREELNQEDREALLLRGADA